MADGTYRLVKENSGGTLDEKTIQAESGKVLGFDASLNPQMLTPGGDLVNDTTPQLGGDLDLNQNCIKLNYNPVTGHMASGNIITLLSGTALSFGNVCYMGSDGKMEKGDADAVANTFCWAMALNTLDENTEGLFALPGTIIYNASWNWTYIGQPVYLDTATAGGMTQTAPSGTDDVIQIIGIAVQYDRILFYPQLVQVEHV